MPHDRFYIDASLLPGEKITLKGSEFRHLCVLRKQITNQVELVNGHRVLAQATLVSLEKKEAILHIDAVLEKNQEDSPPIILAQALCEMNHLEWIIEKATELQVSAIWLFPALLSKKSTLSENQLKRLENLAIAAMKQCGRWELPPIILKPPLDKWDLHSTKIFYADPSPSAVFLWQLPRITTKEPLVFFIGPESGFSPIEIAHLKNVLNAQAICLHPNILRAETAAVATLALVQTILS